jgi:alanine dehydrogenase
VMESAPWPSPTRPWSFPAGELPLLTPMSEVAGRMAIQEGAKYPGEGVRAGSGILLGGVPGVLPGKVLILGGGVVGTHAARWRPAWAPG